MDGSENSVLIDPYIRGSVKLFLNGVLCVLGDFYNEENPDIGLITFRERVYQGDNITIIYLRR